MGAGQGPKLTTGQWYSSCHQLTTTLTSNDHLQLSLSILNFIIYVSLGKGHTSLNKLFNKDTESFPKEFLKKLPNTNSQHPRYLIIARNIRNGK